MHAPTCFHDTCMLQAVRAMRSGSLALKSYDVPCSESIMDPVYWGCRLGESHLAWVSEPRQSHAGFGREEKLREGTLYSSP